MEEANSASISLTDLQGKLIGTIFSSSKVEKGNHQVRFDTSHLPKGLYLYTLQTPTNKETKRLIVR